MADPSVRSDFPHPSSNTRSLQCGDRVLNLDRAVVMGILNATPDSFSDGGLLHRLGSLALDKALAAAERMVVAGAAIIDVGGESTRPGAAPVSVQEELDRVLPIVEAIASRLDVIISVDTSTPDVMRESARRGAGLINDVRALEREGALRAAADSGLPICLMHMQGSPSTMQLNPEYSDVVTEVVAYLSRRVTVAERAGIAPEMIMLDPGFGFGKSVDHNLVLLQRLSDVVALGFPVLVGLSRKSMIDALLGRAVDQRLAASVALAVIAAERGANIIRCHDVQETVDALSMLEFVRHNTCP